MMTHFAQRVGGRCVGSAAGASATVTGSGSCGVSAGERDGAAGASSLLPRRTGGGAAHSPDSLPTGPDGVFLPAGAGGAFVGRGVGAAVGGAAAFSPGPRRTGGVSRHDGAAASAGSTGTRSGPAGASGCVGSSGTRSPTRP